MLSTLNNSVWIAVCASTERSIPHGGVAYGLSWRPRLEFVIDRPDEVYVPTKIDGMTV